MYDFFKYGFLLVFVPAMVGCVNTHFFGYGNPELASESAFSAEPLCKVSSATLDYLNEYPNDSYAVHSGKGVKLRRVRDTLKYICELVREDSKTNTPSRLNNPDFLAKNFDFYLWKPDKQRASALAQKSTNQSKSSKLENIPDHELLLTKYYTKALQGSAVRTERFSQALYAVPNEELNLSEEDIQNNKASLVRFRFKRSDIINGALLDQGLAEPLIWVTEDALHDVLLQGTGLINDGEKVRYFNVHKNNGIAYDYSIGMQEQERYWYFAEVNGVLGYGEELSQKVILEPNVSLAGDIEQIGLGRLFLVQYPVDGVKKKHLAVLADQGGAFENNLFQLDLLVGSYQGWDDYYKANKHIPDYAEVWLMLKKER